MLFWNGVAGKVCLETSSVDECAKIAAFDDFILVSVHKELFLLHKKTFELLDKYTFELEVLAVQGSFIQLADGSVFKLSFESGKITLSSSNEQLLLPSIQEFEAISCGKTVQLKSRESKSLISEVASPAKSFYFLSKYTLLGCWQESQKLFLSPLRLLARCSQSNSCVLPLILWTEKQMFVHRAPLYASWLELQRSELIDVIDSQIGNIKMVASSEDCKALVVVNEEGLAAVCDFKRRLWRPIHLSSIEEVCFLSNKFLILKTGESGKLHLISLAQAELHATTIPLQANLDFFACSSDGSLIAQVGEGLHVFAFTALPSQRQIHFTNAFTCRLPEDERLMQAATQSGLLYLLNSKGLLSILTMNTGELTAQLPRVSAFLCFDDFLLVKQGTWHLYRNSRLFDLNTTADAIYPQLPGIVAIASETPNFSLSASLNSTFLLPKLFHFTAQLRLLERSKEDELVLEYLLIECIEEAELLRQLDDFFCGNIKFTRAIIKCCRKIEPSEGIQLFAHLFNFSPLKIVQMSAPDDCLLFLAFLVKIEDSSAIDLVLSKLSGSQLLEEAQSYLARRQEDAE